jgi:hypothetical protein
LSKYESVDIVVHQNRVMSSSPTLVQIATIGVLGYAAYRAGKMTSEVFGADASPSEIERAVVENPAIVPTISPVGLDSGHQGALYRDTLPATSNTLSNDRGSLGVRPTLTDVNFDSAFASGYSRVTDMPYKVVSHQPVNLQPSFSQYGGGPISSRPDMATPVVNFEAEGDGVETVSDDIGGGAPYTDSTTYSGNSGAVEGVELNEIDSYEQWDTPCCRVCPAGAEAWCQAINSPAASLPKGQRLSPFQDRPLLPNPYTLNATSPQQNATYTDDMGQRMTVGEWSKNYNMNVMSDYGAMAVARDGSRTTQLRRI